MQRLLWMVGALGLGLVICGASHADPHKHRDNQNSDNNNNNQNNNSNSNNQGKNQVKNQDIQNYIRNFKQNDKQDKHQDKPADVNPATGNLSPGLKVGGLLQKLNHDKSTDKKSDDKAVKDAQAAKAAADKAYVDAQNAASVARGQLGSSQAKFDQEAAKADAAVEKYQKGPSTPESRAALNDVNKRLENASAETAKSIAENQAAIAKVNAATAARDKADTDLKAATASQESGSGGSGSTSGKTGGGGMGGIGSVIKIGGPAQKVIDIKSAADNKKASDKAVKDAQAAADKAAADLKVASDKYTQAENEEAAAAAAYLKSGSAQDQAAQDKLRQPTVDASEAKIRASANADAANAALATAKTANTKAGAEVTGAVLHATLPGGDNRAPDGDGSPQQGTVVNYPAVPVDAVPVEPTAPGVASPGEVGLTVSVKGAAAAVPQEQRYLQIRNDTGKPVTIWVQYYSKTDQGQWAWFPADPAKSSKGIAYEIGVGETLGPQGGKMSASRIRFWVKSEAGEWADYKDQDAWLVPEMDTQGKHVYLAKEIEVFPLQLAP